jgi:hypothetical protein
VDSARESSPRQVPPPHDLALTWTDQRGANGGGKRMIFIAVPRQNGPTKTPLRQQKVRLWEAISKTVF